MKIRTSELIDAALDWAVAKCEGIESRNNWQVFFIPHEAESDDPLTFICHADNPVHGVEQCEDAYPDCTVVDYEEVPSYSPSTNWAQGGPIVERIKGLEFKHWLESEPESCCEVHIHNYEGDWVAFGPTPLVAAMRCRVTSKLGDEVDVPEELTCSLTPKNG